MSVQFDSSGRAVADKSNVAVTLGVASLGGTIGARIIVDDAVVTTREQAVLALASISDMLMSKTWPVS